MDISKASLFLGILNFTPALSILLVVSNFFNDGRTAIMLFDVINDVSVCITKAVTNSLHLLFYSTMNDTFQLDTILVVNQTEIWWVAPTLRLLEKSRHI